MLAHSANRSTQFTHLVIFSPILAVFKRHKSGRFDGSSLSVVPMSFAFLCPSRSQTESLQVQDEMSSLMDVFSEKIITCCSNIYYKNIPQADGECGQLVSPKLVNITFSASAYRSETNVDNTK